MSPIRKKKRIPEEVVQLKTRPVLKGTPGTAPGTVEFSADADDTRIRAIAYNSESIHESEIESIDELAKLLEGDHTVWVTLEGYGSEEKLTGLQKLLDLHQLAFEDIINGQQRAKIEPYGDSLFIVARVPHGGGEQGTPRGDTKTSCWMA